MVAITMYLCGFAILFFAPEATIILSFLLFALCSLFLYEDRIVPLAATGVMALFQWPSFLILSTFHIWFKSYLGMNNLGWLFVSMIGVYIGLIINVFFHALVFTEYLKTKNWVQAFSSAYKKFVVNIRFVLLPVGVFTIVCLGSSASTEVTLLVMYPFIMLLARSWILQLSQH